MTGVQAVEPLLFAAAPASVARTDVQDRCPLLWCSGFLQSNPMFKLAGGSEAVGDEDSRKATLAALIASKTVPSTLQWAMVQVRTRGMGGEGCRNGWGHTGLLLSSRAHT